VFLRVHPGIEPGILARRNPSRLPSASLSDGVDQAQHGGLALDALFKKSGSRFAELPVRLSPLAEFFNTVRSNRP
jgi:hypothetical protein